jgi:phosphoribosylglycinamide formyltransferase-1
MKKKLLFLSSSSGTNFEACVDYLKKNKIDIEILGLICDNPSAQVVERSKNLGILSFLIPFTDFASKEDFHSEILNKTLSLSPDLIIAVGYMRILKKQFVEKFKNRIINVHPSLLPAFPGLNAVEQAFTYGAKITGCTTHFIDEGVDTGPIILQSAVEILPNMNLEDVREKIKLEEHRILPLSVRYFCEDRLVIQNRKCIII